ncbi:DUF6492 family protein [Aquimarina sp. AU474]|uniref:DUF6492 family protein n=1 Tax=Aquimarina sp. AU474 TaxID=2108529 RepID=UPI000D68A850|nr:DUF6492 family protein [Aquimarina sp. AU474]
MSNIIKFTFVLPTRLKGGRKFDDYLRLKKILIPSLRKNLLHKEEIELLIITPEEDLYHFDPVDLGLLDFKYRVFTDKDVVGKQQFIIGWFKQQLIKLAIAGEVKSSHYLTLDSDLILCNPISYKDFFQEDKPIIQKEKYQYHLNWWINTAQLMGYDQNFNPHENCPGVTPAVLSKELVIGLVNHLRNHFKTHDWMGALTIQIKNFSKIPWTEYCLYWLYLMNEHDISRYYHTHPQKVLLGESIWTESDYHTMKGEIVNKFFTYDHHMFSIVQSNLNELDFNDLVTEISTQINDELNN